VLSVSYRQEIVKPKGRILPTGRKTAQNFLDKSLGLSVSLVGRKGRLAALFPDRPEERTNV